MQGRGVDWWQGHGTGEAWGERMGHGATHSHGAATTTTHHSKTPKNRTRADQIRPPPP